MHPIAQNAAYNDAFYALRGQIAQYGSPAATAVDWSAVEAAATALLAQKQDLQSGCYLCFAQIIQRGVAALPTALDALDAMCTNHWASMTPPVARQRARITILQWLHEQLLVVLGGAQAESASHYAAAMQAAKRLDARLLPHLNDAAPRFILVINALAPPPRAPEPAGAVQIPPLQATDVGPVAVPTKPPSPAIMPSADNLVSVGQILLAQANAHLAIHPYDAGALRLRRQGLWLHITQAPDNVGAVTRIAPLAAPILTQLATLQAAQDWPALLACAEGAMPRHRLILALQRYSAEALRAMGPPFGRASLGIAAETYALVLRLPGLLTACAADGSKLIDSNTQRWLAELPLLSAASPEQKASVPPPTAANDDEPAHPSAQRTVMLAQLKQAEKLMAAGEHVVARAAFCALGRTLRQAQLFTWEPHVACRIWSGEAQALARMPKAPERTARLVKLMERIAGYDVHSAQSLHQSLKLLGVSS
jgi:type VI secretion system protein VasJ